MSKTVHVCLSEGTAIVGKKPIPAEATYVWEAMPPPVAQLSLKTLFEPGISMPLSVLIAFVAAAGLASSTKQYPALALNKNRTIED
jgi:hypothetical protein